MALAGSGGQNATVSLKSRRREGSKPVFAHYLRTNPRTLENLEQGRARPNAQAALLIGPAETRSLAA